MSYSRDRALDLVSRGDHDSRFRFALAYDRGFRYGDPIFDPVLQVRELEAGVLGEYGGRVRFHPAFGQTESEQS